MGEPENNTVPAGPQAAVLTPAPSGTEASGASGQGPADTDAARVAEETVNQFTMEQMQLLLIEMTKRIERERAETQQAIQAGREESRQENRQTNQNLEEWGRVAQQAMLRLQKSEQLEEQARLRKSEQLERARSPTESCRRCHHSRAHGNRTIRYSGSAS